MNRHITAGSTSRQRAGAALAFEYQDSGFEFALIDGNLDAADQVPAGSHVCLRELARRNVAAPQLAGREVAP